MHNYTFFFRILTSLLHLDTSSLNDCKNNDIQQPLTTVSELLTDEKNVHEDMTTKTNDEPILSSIECQKETIINMNNDIVHHEQMDINNSEIITDLSSLNSPSSSLLLISSSLTTNTNENKSIEFLLKETDEEEEKKREEEDCDDDNVDVEKKNNCNVECNYHASGTILINAEPTQLVFLEQEKKEKEEEQETERRSSPLPTPESCNQSQPEDESSLPTLSNNLEEMTMTNIDENEQRYKTVEIEEIPDEEEDLSVHNNHSIEPTDCILTDDELRTTNTTTTNKTYSTS